MLRLYLHLHRHGFNQIQRRFGLDVSTTVHFRTHLRVDEHAPLNACRSVVVNIRIVI